MLCLRSLLFTRPPSAGLPPAPSWTLLFLCTCPGDLMGVCLCLHLQPPRGVPDSGVLCLWLHTRALWICLSEDGVLLLCPLCTPYYHLFISSTRKSGNQTCESSYTSKSWELCSRTSVCRDSDHVHCCRHGGADHHFCPRSLSFQCFPCFCPALRYVLLNVTHKCVTQ